MTNRLQKFGIFLMALFYPFSITGLQTGLTIASLGWLLGKKEKPPLTLPILLFSFVSLIFIPFSLDPARSIVKAKVLLSAITFFVLVNSPDLKKFIKLLLFSTTIAGIYGIVQEVMNWGVRAGGTLGYQTFSAILFPVLMIEIALLLFGKKDRRFLMPSILIIALALIFTYTRSIYIATAIGIGIILYTKKKWWLGVYIIFFLIFLALISNLGLVRAIISPLDPKSSRYGSDRDRMEMYSSAISIIKDRPITGIGMGCYGKVAPNYLKINPKHFRIANDFLHIWVERGIFSFLAYIFLIVSFIGYGIRAFKETHSPFVIGGLAGFVGLVVSGLFEPRFTAPHTNIVIYILMGIAINSKCSSYQ